VEVCADAPTIQHNHAESFDDHDSNRFTAPDSHIGHELDLPLSMPTKRLASAAVKDQAGARS
jgi:hypothetical protein